MAQGPLTEGPVRPRCPGTAATPSKCPAMAPRDEMAPGPVFCLVPRKATATPWVSK